MTYRDKGVMSFSCWPGQSHEHTTIKMILPYVTHFTAQLALRTPIIIVASVCISRRTSTPYTATMAASAAVSIGRANTVSLLSYAVRSATRCVNSG